MVGRRYLRDAGSMNRRLSSVRATVLAAVLLASIVGCSAQTPFEVVEPVAAVTATPPDAATPVPEPATPRPEATLAPEPLPTPESLLSDRSEPHHLELEYPLPEGFTAVDAVVSTTVNADDPSLLTADYNQVLVFGGAGIEPVLTVLKSSEFVTASAELDGAFVIAVSSIDAEPLLPSIRVWSPDALAWQEQATTITRPASWSTTRSSSAVTPPSPPWEGASGIFEMTVHDGVIWASGWATVDGETRGVLWRSRDARDWTLELLPPIGTGVEFGQDLSVNERGVAVNVGNWTHFGAGILARTHGGDWAVLPFPETSDATRLTTVADSDDGTWWLLEVRFEEADVLHYSIDGADPASPDSWATIELPTDYGSHGVWSLDPGHPSGPIAWVAIGRQIGEDGLTPGWQWDSTEGRFNHVDVQGRPIATSGRWLISQADDRIVVVPGP